jgi:hypothetical protein
LARQFKPLRFFVLMALAAFLACGATAFFTHRAEHGRTKEERAAYVVGERAGDEAAPGAKLPTAAALNTLAQQYFAKQGAGEPMAWKNAFESGYTNGFKKTHRVP